MWFGIPKVAPLLAKIADRSCPHEFNSNVLACAPARLRGLLGKRLARQSLEFGFAKLRAVVVLPAHVFWLHQRRTVSCFDLPACKQRFLLVQ